jgi:hypothetical protein
MLATVAGLSGAINRWCVPRKRVVPPFAGSEAVDGAGAKADTVFGVIIGTGCGGGIAVRRHLFPERSGFPGNDGQNRYRK